MKKILALFVLLVVALAIGAPAFGDIQQVRDRMSARLGQIDQLKLQGLVGEDNQGYLAVRGAGSEEAAKVVAAENEDRKAVYAAIAKQQNTSAETVGKLRAQQIADKAAAGVWLQGGDGQWRKK